MAYNTTISLQDTFSPSFTPRCITVCPVQSMLTSSVSAPVRTGGTAGLRNASAAGRIGPKALVQVVALPLLVELLLLPPTLLAPDCLRSDKPFFSRFPKSSMIPGC